MPGHIESLWSRAAKKTCFREVEASTFEQVKINLLRVILGLIILWRLARVAIAVPLYFGHDATLTSGLVLAECSLVLCFTIGFLTPLTTLAIILTINWLDQLLLIETLGTSVLTLLLLGFLCANTGRRFSIDAWLMDRHPQSEPAGWARTLYRFAGDPDAPRLRVIYLLLLVAYGLTSFAAITLHLTDSFWITGRTTSVMLTSSYHCRWWDFFRWLQRTQPQLFFLMSAIGGVGQSVFQVLMIPLAFSRIGARFVIFWGLLFFLMSALLLQLSYLPAVEFVYWALLFLRQPTTWKLASADNAPKLAANDTFHRFSTTWATTVFVAYGFFLCFHRGWIESRSPWIETLYRTLYRHGMQIPDVFNSTDLRCANTWPVIHRQDSHGRRTLVPFTGHNGQRLAYHHNDIVYFRNSLRWRRAIIGQPIDAFNAPDTYGFRHLAEIAQFDYRINGLERPAVYLISVFRNNGSHSDTEQPNRFQVQSSYHFRLTVDAGDIIGTESVDPSRAASPPVTAAP